MSSPWLFFHLTLSQCIILQTHRLGLYPPCCSQSFLGIGGGSSLLSPLEKFLAIVPQWRFELSTATQREMLPSTWPFL